MALVGKELIVDKPLWCFLLTNSPISLGKEHQSHHQELYQVSCNCCQRVCTWENAAQSKRQNKGHAFLKSFKKQKKIVFN